MAEPWAGALEIAVEVGAIASAPARSEERAQAILDVLYRVLPFQAAQISLVNPRAREPASLVVQGYDDELVAYFNSSAVVDEFELLGLHRAGPPMRVSDLPVPPEEVYGWAEYLAPAGFRGGLSTGLHTSDGRYIGVLGLNTDTVLHPTVAARDLIGVIAPVIACAVDPLRSVAWAAWLVHDAQAGIVLTRTNEVLPLPGLPFHGLLSNGSGVLPVAAKLAGEHMHASFLCPDAGSGMEEGHVRISVVACTPQPPYYLVAAVMASPAGDTHGLTPRELQLLGLLVEGWPNRRIASALAIAERTVATHIEHILAKLCARSRAVAAVRALKEGIYVPWQLTPTYGAQND
jgi:DNA-binding CsgD family transcriptional regulator